MSSRTGRHQGQPKGTGEGEGPLCPAGLLPPRGRQGMSVAPHLEAR